MFFFTTKFYCDIFTKFFIRTIYTTMFTTNILYAVEGLYNAQIETRDFVY